MITAHQSPGILPADTMDEKGSGLHAKQQRKFLSPALNEASFFFEELRSRHGKSAGLAAILAVTVNYAIRCKLSITVAAVLKQNTSLLENTIGIRPPKQAGARKQKPTTRSSSQFGTWMSFSSYEKRLLTFNNKFLDINMQIISFELF